MFTNNRCPHLYTVLHEGRYLPYKTKYISGKTNFTQFMGIGTAKIAVKRKSSVVKMPTTTTHAVYCPWQVLLQGRGYPVLAGRGGGTLSWSWLQGGEGGRDTPVIRPEADWYPLLQTRCKTGVPIPLPLGKDLGSETRGTPLPHSKGPGTRDQGSVSRVPRPPVDIQTPVNTVPSPSFGCGR